MSMGELNSITGKFGQKALIGEGSYGKIYKAVLASGEPVAIKKLDPSVSSDSLADFSSQVSQVTVTTPGACARSIRDQTLIY
jgi:serine/threonine protein kinase